MACDDFTEPADDCTCVWEGPQSFEVLSASQDQTQVFVELRTTLSPCCADTTTREEFLQIDLSGYDGGDIDANGVSLGAGDALPVDADGSLEPVALDVWLDRNPDTIIDVSVDLDEVALYEIVDATSQEVRGFIYVPAGL